MKLKKIMIAFFSAVIAVFLMVVVYTQMDRATKIKSKTVFIAMDTIRSGEKIGEKAIQTTIDISAPVVSPGDVSNLFAKTTIPKGCIITPELVANTVYEDVYTTHIVVKVDPVPLEAFKNAEYIGLLNVETANNQTHTNVFEHLKLVRLYDQAGREAGKTTNEYSSNLVSMVEIATDNSTAKRIKEKEKLGVYYVLIQ
ncbi:hypothetical protein [Caldicellulosiruptor morganii]|uniref:SAF domain protein n=1 Tax=Caldicellulosiruptor morganii TaxID=1387555 RepID=A0ABY7BKG1_9FIRM|nr:hypothetical protein [Caldicellulosiruptor morganii]WAM33304.1 hypothetical protein OTK00_001799 [Caldicellulosiruptor morganii]